MNSTNQHHEMELREALNAFEQRLEQPIVPGEMESWLRSAHEACAQLSTILFERIDHGHGVLLRAILREDTSLASRVEQMEEEDQAILARAAELEATAAQLVTAAAKVEPHESKLQGTVEQFGEEALKFILRVRKQESALETWYQEALMRDRGVVD